MNPVRFQLLAFQAALQFLTVLPSGRPVDREKLSGSLPWFPVAGLIIGLVSFLAYALALLIGLPVMAASLIGVLVLSGIAGFLHLDGLADTGDGFFSSRSREKILAIMRDSRIGTMGVVSLFAVLGLKWSALASLPPETAFKALVLVPVLGRSAQVISMTLLPYARTEGGLASVFILRRRRSNMYWALGISVGAALILAGAVGLAALFAAAAAAALFSLWCRKKINGITGDTLGAVTEIVETAAMLAICVAVTGLAR